jgi:thiol-disulfide isomerase/thioredoxin
MLLISLLACDGGGKEAAPPPNQRFEAVQATAPKKADTAGFCTDVHADAASAKPFALPKIDGAPMASSEGWKWINVWATWCGPCVAELPMLAKWQDRLAQAGTNVSLEFLSVDKSADDIAKYRTQHPNTPPSMRLANFDDLPGWLTGVGLDANAVIPIHVFVDPADKVRCVRMGAVDESDFDTVKAVLAGE